MLKRFDHIIKNALESYMAPHVPDWDVFYDLLRAEQDAPLSDDQMDDEIGEVLGDMDYIASVPMWASFESRLDALNSEMDAEFDQSVRDALENVVGESWGLGHWSMMSPRLDDLNTELDNQFDQTIGNALVSIPEATWKESHWKMLSARLDQLNDRPRLLMMKVIEAAAILLILIQLTNLYSDYQRNNSTENPLASFIEQFFEDREGTDNVHERDIVVPPNSFPPLEKMDDDHLAGKQDQEKDGIYESHGQSDLVNNSYEESTISGNARDRDNDFDFAVTSDESHRIKSARVMQLPRVSRDFIRYNDLERLNQILPGNEYSKEVEALPNLDTDPNLIAYDDTPTRLQNPAARLGVRDINLLTANTSDSILHSIPTFQVIKPRLYSSMEVGTLADATTVEIQDFYSVSQDPYDVPTLNAGLYFRYKIQYQDMFGSLGGDFLRIKYGGQNNENDLAMVTLPFELGYNVVNLPALRMYFSGGVAGRFVPVASYSPDPYNQSSDYNRESNKQSNGLLNNGPFEINSYLSGRLSMGLDINVNKKTSVNLRFSHDIWLKGRGIGYNLDKFRSSHLAIGANHHF